MSHSITCLRFVCAFHWQIQGDQQIQLWSPPIGKRHSIIYSSNYPWHRILEVKRDKVFPSAADTVSKELNRRAIFDCWGQFEADDWSVGSRLQLPRMIFHQPPGYETACNPKSTAAWTLWHAGSTLICVVDVRIMGRVAESRVSSYLSP